MGLVHSMFCSITFCIERVLTWTCCAFILMLLMFTIILMMIYGISVGYHYAQKELASFAMQSRTTTAAPSKLGGMKRRSVGDDLGPVVRLLAVNRTSEEMPPPPSVIDPLRSQETSENMYMEKSATPMVLLETERPPRAPALSPNERDLARRLIGRFRRSKNYTLTVSTANVKYSRSLENFTETAKYAMI